MESLAILRVFRRGGIPTKTDRDAGVVQAEIDISDGVLHKEVSIVHWGE